MPTIFIATTYCNQQDVWLLPLNADSFNVSY